MAESSLRAFARVSRWYDRLVADWVTVYEWNPRLYQRVSLSGFAFGFATAAFLAAAGWIISFLVTHG